MQTILTVVAVAAAALLGWWFWEMQASSDGGTNVMVSEALGPEVESVEFPSQIPADGEAVGGVVNFFAPTGTLVMARFEVVEASFFMPFEFDPQITDINDGSFEFYMSTIIPQQVTLRVMLVDDEGNASEPFEFSFSATQADDPFATDGE